MDFVLLQSLAMPVLLMCAGIVLLIQGGNWTIDSSVFIARRFGLSPLIVGFTILAFGTSLPELIVSVLAVLRGSAGIAMGNVIGSNIANILLVIGSVSLFVTFTVHFSKALVRDLVMMLACSGLLLGFMFYGGIGRMAGLGMIILLLVYVYVQYRMARSGHHDGDHVVEEIEEELACTSFHMCFWLLA